MSFNAATLRLMAEKGLSALDIAELAEAMEGGSPSSAAVRQRRYRDKKRNERDVTRDVTPPPIEDHTPRSVSDETGAKPPDPVKGLFDLGISMLAEQGKTEKEARSLVGSWRKGRKDGDVAAALLEARTKAISNLVEWMPKRLGSMNGGTRNFEDIIAEEYGRRRPAEARA